MKNSINFILLMLILLNHPLIASAQETQQTQEQNPVAEAFFAASTIAFLGDSITYRGTFITDLESTMVANGKTGPKLLNLGLPSETCSGCSEPAHPWPRPNVHERFDRVLDKLKPDLLVVNYGMNDGIYHPFDKTRFEKFKQGINIIIEAADKSDGKLKVILVTPPTFDALPLKAKNKLAAGDAKNFSWKRVYENYDTDVLAVYSEWVMNQKDRVLGCIDLRTPILETLANKRKTDPDFHFAKDGVHVDAAGHRLIAQTMATAIGLDPAKTLSADLEKTVNSKQVVLRDSWLSEIGHKRPGVKPGIPLDKALAAADQADKLIAENFEQSTQEKKAK